MRGMQVPSSEVHTGVHFRTVLPSERPRALRMRPPRLRRQQRRQDPQRATSIPARGCGEVPCVPGEGTPPQPGLWLHLPSLHPPAAPPPETCRPRKRQERT
ncbi:hypothetical protein Ahy_B04g070263 isoform E [Arachis hypogaea]|uniref:Uncharacterized protein n=1 Tax=Arachis hypogaea TaxID=3818 RepID=A0A444ZFV5_ARAHY|nr:hypothetical protein Ahy_B04g070263 isoform E [Arachis hypogaea]